MQQRDYELLRRELADLAREEHLRAVEVEEVEVFEEVEAVKAVQAV